MSSDLVILILKHLVITSMFIFGRHNWNFTNFHRILTEFSVRYGSFFQIMTGKYAVYAFKNVHNN